LGPISRILCGIAEGKWDYLDYFGQKRENGPKSSFPREGIQEKTAPREGIQEKTAPRAGSQTIPNPNNPKISFISGKSSQTSMKYTEDVHKIPKLW